VGTIDGFVISNDLRDYLSYSGLLHTDLLQKISRRYRSLEMTLFIIKSYKTQEAMGLKPIASALLF